MSLIRKNNIRKSRRAYRVRSRLKDSSLPRVSVFRSLKNISAQLIDDTARKTVVSCSSSELKTKGDKKAQAHAVGIELAKRAKDKGVEIAKFDRGAYLFHGRIKALAEGLREGGIKI